MRKMVFWLTAQLMSTMPFLYAQTFLDCSSIQGCWEAGAALVYFKPCMTELPYVVIATPNNVSPLRSRKYLTFSPEYNPGFTLFASFYACDGSYFGRLYWTHFSSTKQGGQDAHPDFELLSLFSLPFGEEIVRKVRVTYQSQYDTAGLQAGWELGCVCRSWVYFYAGARYIGIRDKFRIRSQRPDSTVTVFRGSTQFYGGGLEAGFGGSFDVGYCFGLSAQAGAITALGQKRNNTLQTDPSSILGPRRSSTTIPPLWTCVPGATLRAAITYTWSCCLKLIAEVGYQADIYLNVVDFPRPLTTLGVQDRKEHRVYAGPYGQLKIIF